MSKELLIAGAIVLVCLGVTAVAFIPPKGAPTAAPIDIARTDTGLGEEPATPSPLETNFDRNTPLLPPPGTSSGPAPLSTYDPLSTTGSPSFPNPPATRGLPPAPSSGPLPMPMFEPMPVPAGGDEAKTHVVKRGELLGEISQKYYGTTRQWKRIAEANSVNPEDLREGQKLVIPVLPKAAAAPAVDAASTDVAAGGYTVRANDTYYSIAKRELGDAGRYKEIQRLNGDKELHPGMSITLPERRTASELGKPVLGDADPLPPAGSRVHTVAKDETLVDISIAYFRTSKRWRDIVKANPGVDPERLKVGQKLIIPDAGAAAASAGSVPDTASTSGSDYVIKRGDTFETIAQQVYGDRKQWRKIADANQGVDPSHLRIGQKIVVPDAPGAAPRGGGFESFPAPTNAGGPTFGGAPAPMPDRTVPAPEPIDPATFPIFAPNELPPPPSDAPARTAPSDASPFPGASGSSNTNPSSSTFDETWGAPGTTGSTFPTR
ncbi:MAG: LysM peptidoglycan-binding domain-containing protein [Planctomycetes bacterium]|nr:LysM peptidoglycan-binding domain-containing protein [Planctomycetota bacterium]